MKSVCIIIPVKDEEKGLQFLYDDFTNSNIKNLFDISFIFVIDERTSDSSKEVASLFSTKIIDQKETQGKGSAVREAVDMWKNNQTDFIIFLDADGSYSFNDVFTILKSLSEVNEVVSGSRFLNINSHPMGMSKLHIFGNKVLSRVSSIKNKNNITDLCTGLWGFNRFALNKLSLNAKGFDLEAELAGKSRKEGLNHIEVQVNWSARKGGFSKIRSFRDGFIILLRILRT